MKTSPSWLRMAASLIPRAVKPLTKNRKRHTQNLFQVERCDERVLLAAGANDATASIAAPAVLPNLRGSMFSITSPLGHSAGDVLSFSFRVQNFTTGAAGPFVSRIYMSSDPVITVSDRFLGETSDDFGILGQSNSTHTWFVSLPGYNDSIWINGTATYYLGVIIDANQQVPESNESDNSSFGFGLDLASFQVTVSRPDFVGWIYPPAGDLKPGDTLSLSTLVSNVASTPFGGMVRQSIYLSRDTVITTSDRLLLTRDTSVQLAANGSYLLSFSSTLPSRNDTFWSGDGNYYIGVIVDPDNQVLETNELNNSNRSLGVDVGTIQVTVTQPDLLASIVAPTAELQPGDSLVLSMQVSNVWSKSFIGSLDYAMYLSRDSFIDSSDRLLFSGNTSLQIGPNGTYTIFYSTVLPPQDDAFWSNASTYYVGLILDPENQVAESDEGNNSNRGVGQDVQAITVRTPLNLESLPPTGVRPGFLLAGYYRLLADSLKTAVLDWKGIQKDAAGLVDLSDLVTKLSAMSASISPVIALLDKFSAGTITQAQLAPGLTLDAHGIDLTERLLLNFVEAYESSKPKASSSILRVAMTSPSQSAISSDVAEFINKHFGPMFHEMSPNTVRQFAVDNVSKAASIFLGGAGAIISKVTTVASTAFKMGSVGVGAFARGTDFEKVAESNGDTIESVFWSTLRGQVNSVLSGDFPAGQAFLKFAKNADAVADAVRDAGNKLVGFRDILYSRFRSRWFSGTWKGIQTSISQLNGQDITAEDPVTITFGKWSNGVITGTIKGVARVYNEAGKVVKKIATSSTFRGSFPDPNKMQGQVTFKNVLTGGTETRSFGWDYDGLSLKGQMGTLSTSVNVKKR